MSIVLFISGKDALAIGYKQITKMSHLSDSNQEYSTYKSQKHEIQFEYPTDWKIIEKESRFDKGPDIKVYSPSLDEQLNIVHKFNSGKLTVSERMHQMYEAQKTDDDNIVVKTIESPKIMTYAYTSPFEKEVGDFLLMKENIDSGEKKAYKTWITISRANEVYIMTFLSSTDVFDNSENEDIRDQFIHSVRFIGLGNALIK